jgi:seryl-tRNA synthetase
MTREPAGRAGTNGWDADHPGAPGAELTEGSGGCADDRRFRASLLEHGLFVPSGVPGIYGLGRVLVDLMARVEAALTRLIRAGDVEVMRFPPVISRDTVERIGYHETFPHLLGTVHTFGGDAAAHARLMRAGSTVAESDGHRVPSDVALTPASCHAVYPHLAGTLPEVGRTIDVESWCFRQEPSDDPGRLRAFRMRELVRSGGPDEVRDWRDHWIMRGVTFLQMLGLDPVVAPATDAFFGRGRQMLANSQRAQGLKFEVTVAAASASGRMAVMSCNYHREHFGELFDIRTCEGKIAHTACVGFGLERCALALLWTHGLDPTAWPDDVRGALE